MWISRPIESLMVVEYSGQYKLELAELVDNFESDFWVFLDDGKFFAVEFPRLQQDTIPILPTS